MLHKAGYAPVHSKARPVGDEHPRRFEAPHRNALWQLDLTELRVGSELRWMLVVTRNETNRTPSPPSGRDR